MRARSQWVQVTTEGDAFLIAWHTPVEAARWSMLLQLALLELDWWVRGRGSGGCGAWRCVCACGGEGAFIAHAWLVLSLPAALGYV